MRRTKSFEEHKNWYVSAVKSHLILRAGYLETDADKAITMYNLEQKIDECPDIAFHDDPRSIAREITKRQYLKT